MRMRNLARTALRPLPAPTQAWLKKLAAKWIATVPFTAAHARERWLSRVYSSFARGQKLHIFLSIARFLNINRPIPGYYFEFGCFGAHTMRMAWDHFHHLFDMGYVAFDSFRGLPEITEVDAQEIWEQGKLAMSEEEFVRVVTRHGMPRSRLRTVQGFFDTSLTQELKDQLLPTKAAVIYVDCDLYASTVPVLNWVVDFLQRGTVIVFDDWNCFCGDPDRGERRAWKEFRELHPTLRFEPFVATNEAQAFVYLG